MPNNKAYRGGFQPCSPLEVMADEAAAYVAGLPTGEQYVTPAGVVMQVMPTTTTTTTTSAPTTTTTTTTTTT
jgi:hypothetical protein